jgi:Flp pilus assembly pilin Flp
MMKQFLRKLWKSEKGAEVVEWVIVAAVLVGVAAAAYAFLGNNINDAVNVVGDKLTSAVNDAS